MINQITLENMLPRVFDGQQDRSPVKDSHIWLREVSFKKGVDYLVYAESGTGKSSMCAYIYGSRRDFSGRVLFDGVDSSTFPIERWAELRRVSLAYLPQDMRLFPELTAMENIMIKNRLTDYFSQADILQMMDQLEIAHKADVPARLLSIGQQQRVAIIRALAQPFDFLLLDEPVSHLDARNNEMVATMITNHAERQHAAIIATSVGNHIAIDANKIFKL